MSSFFDGVLLSRRRPLGRAAAVAALIVWAHSSCGRELSCYSVRFTHTYRRCLDLLEVFDQFTVGHVFTSLSVICVFFSFYQSSSSNADNPSASSTHDGSYFVLPITALQDGHVLYGLSDMAPHLEHIYSSDLNKCVL